MGSGGHCSSTHFIPIYYFKVKAKKTGLLIEARLFLLKAGESGFDQMNF